MKNKKIVRTNAPHSCHDDHYVIYKDMLTSNEIKRVCKQFHEALGGAARKIDTRRIFNNMLSKYTDFFGRVEELNSSVDY